jgi:hypothetical protein
VVGLKTGFIRSETVPHQDTGDVSFQGGKEFAKAPGHSLIFFFLVWQKFAPFFVTGWSTPFRKNLDVQWCRIHQQ